MSEGIMDKFELPSNIEEAGARETVNKLQFKSIEQGVNVMSGHDKGVAYRFFTTEEFDGGNSDSNIEAECVLPLYNEHDAVEFLFSRKRRPVQFVKHLSRERIRFGADGEVIGGTMAEDYKRWKAGSGPQGTPLELWKEIGPGTLKTLQSQNIFTVEQFASMPREKVQDIFPKSIQVIFEHLVDYISGKEAAEVSAEYEEKVAQLEAQIAELQASKESVPEVKKKRGRGRPSKNETVS
jgi:hypothetical protein